MFGAFTFLAAALLATTFACLALVRVALLRLESSIGIWRDGLPSGSQAPRWSLRDQDGIVRRTPSGDTWQILVFCDHGLREFPLLARRLDQIAHDGKTEVLVLTRRRAAVTEAVLDAFGVRLPVVSVDDGFYWRWNVRVMPYVIIVDPAGVAWSSNVITEPANLDLVWRLTLEWAAGHAARSPALPGRRKLEPIA